MSDNEDEEIVQKNEEIVQKEVSELLKKSFNHPDVVAFTEILLEEFPDIKNDTQLDLALKIKSLDDKRFDRYLNYLLTKPKSFTERSIEHLASGKKSKKKKKTRKVRKQKRKSRKIKKQKRRKTRRGRK